MKQKIINTTHSNSDLALSEKTVLVVEDDRSHRALIEKILSFCGFKTVQAENGLAALSKLDTGQHFDLILMDWDMPGLNGLETAKAIRAREIKEETPHKPIIAFTARRNSGDRERCLVAGMDAYLPKDVFLPHWRDTLIDNLQGLIAGNFDLQDFEEETSNEKNEILLDFDLQDFDKDTFVQTGNLLKEELPIAIEEYLEDAAAYIRDIEMGLNNNDFVKMAHGSHPLKSNSKGFGLTSVSAIAESINLICEQQEQNTAALEKVKQLYPQLKKAFDIGEQRLQQELKSISF